MKKALLVGINNYPGTGSDLRGCVNDAADLQVLLLGRGWGGPDITVLLDKEATQARILAELDMMVRQLKPGDEAFVALSGHGSQVPCIHGDEKDRKDEVFCAWDYDRHWSDPLSDDKLRRCLSMKDPNAMLTILLDCCHSGTGTREVGAERSRYLKPPAHAAEEWTLPFNRLGIRQDERWATSAHMNHLCFAACRSTQTAADAEFDGRSNGAMTWGFCKAVLERNAAATANDIYLGLKSHLRGAGHLQSPQLEGPAALRGRSLFWVAP